MNYKINGNENVLFNNNAFYCVGTGRMGLALQKHYFEQLKLVQEKIGFEHIRGHGLFSDDMAIYREYKEKEDAPAIIEYCWTYLDMVMDSYKEVGLRPFLELGFMPKKLASGDQTIFYWKGNVTPPSDYKKWTDLVQATLTHLIERYGRDEVVEWPVEVWNEPNLPGFWKDADMNEYFKLYDLTSRAVKEVDQRFKVGGPAVCGGTDKEWIKGFLEYVEAHKCPLDFVSRHHYTTSLPERNGHYGYPKLHEVSACFEQLDSTRGIVDSFEKFNKMYIHVTEFNTSYVPNAPVHDTNQNAAYIANMLATFGDNHASYSYWTFGDIFEEFGVPFTPFHGGFGLVANGLIPKPTFWTFAFYKNLTKQYKKCVLKTPECVVVQSADSANGATCPAGGESAKSVAGACGASDINSGVCYKGVAWNIREQKPITLELELPLPAEDDANVLVTHMTDENVCNPLKVWHDLGEHPNPPAEEIELLRAAAVPQITTKRCGNTVSITLEKNAVCYFEVRNAPIKSDRGYIYNAEY